MESSPTTTTSTTAAAIPIKENNSKIQEIENEKDTSSSSNKDNNNSHNNNNNNKEEYIVRCHCKRLQGKFKCNKNEVIAWDCNCSDCNMRKNVHIIIPEIDFTLTMEDESLEDATILYLWGTKTAKRYFCKTCGILPWYHPRSNPDGYAITLNCIDWNSNTTTNNSKPNVIIKKYDGQNWEQYYNKSNISEQSKIKTTKTKTNNETNKSSSGNGEDEPPNKKAKAE